MLSFSIVIPTYNGSDYIEQALQSALAQTRPADEIIVSDDNSTDTTLEICRKYADRIKIYSNPQGPSGFVNGWNHAIAKATSEYIAILHQDDVLAPTFLAEIEKALCIYPDVKHLFVPCNNIDATGHILQDPDYCTGEIKRYTGQEYVMAYQTIGHPHIHRCPGVVTHRSIFDLCQYREEAGHIADDDFFYRVGQYTDVVGILKPLASYRLHDKSETGHLTNCMLLERLAHDYIFQLQHFSENICFGKEAFAYFKNGARHSFFDVFIGGIKMKDKVLIKDGWLGLQTLKQDFKCEFPLKINIALVLVRVLGVGLLSNILNLRRNKLLMYVKSLVRELRISFLHLIIQTRHHIKFNAEATILVVAPHPDDEVFGCSGLIQRMLQEKRQVDVVILSGGGESHAGCCQIEESLLIDSRRNLSRKAAGLLGLPLKNLHFLNYPDGSISFDCPETNQLKNLIKELQPDAIFVPHRGEGWSDHLAAGDVVRKLIGQDSQIEMYEYCVWFWFYNVWNIDWKKARILTMSPLEHKNKNRAIDAYILPKAPCGNPWSGVLPNVFVRANRWKKELYFKQSGL